MEARFKPLTSPPPLLGSLIAGFNTVASHAWLIVFPFVLDLWIWLGPHLRVGQAFALSAEETDLLRQIFAPDLSLQAWQGLFSQFNLFGVLRTFPVGVPSLFSGQGIADTPFGPAQGVELPTLGLMMLVWLVLFLLGTVAGSLYLAQVAGVCSGQKGSLSLPELAWQSVQSIALALLMVAMLLVTVIPLGFLLYILLSVNPIFEILAGILIAFLASWFLVPLTFSVHGIFTYRMNVLLSISTSVRLVRFFLPGTGLLVVIALLLVLVSNLLWRVPPASSWMAIVGLAGHAFITTGLIAGSFVYYLGGMRTMHEVLQRISADQPQA